MADPVLIRDNLGKTFLVDFNTGTRQAVSASQAGQLTKQFGPVQSNPNQVLSADQRYQQNLLGNRFGADLSGSVSLDVRLGFRDGTLVNLGQGGGGGGDESGTFDYRSAAAGEYPWLTGEMLGLFAQFWADTGSGLGALGQLRQTSQYSARFPGIKREDGTLRMDENQYLGTEAGYREAFAEFGKAGRFEDKFISLFKNEVGADELFRTLSDAVGRFVEPGAPIDNGLTDQFIDNFLNSGSAVTALQSVRESSEYDNVFAGNRREDGTLRMDESEYFGYKRGWQVTLADFGLNPDLFSGRGLLRQSVEGDLSIAEIGDRLQVTQDGIVDNVGAVQAFYGQNYGIDLDTPTILAMSIDPDLQRDVLERRITAAQIGGEAQVQGFRRDVARAEELARLGVTQGQARDAYSNAARRLRGISGATERFNRGSTGIGEFEDVTFAGDAAQGERLDRSLRREQAQFGSRADTAGGGNGLTGLGRR